MKLSKTYLLNLIFFTHIINCTETILQINVDGHRGGFFSWFKGVITYLDTYDQEQAHLYNGIRFNFTGSFYNDPNKGPNWWDYFFEQPTINENTAVTSKTLPMHEWHYFCNHGCSVNFSREQAHKMIKKYIRIKPHIQQKIDDYAVQNFSGYFIIGIHYRGTDKMALEATRISHESIIDEIQKITTNLSSPYKIFVATDDDQFLKYTKSQYNNVLHLDIRRSVSNLPLHYGPYADLVSAYDLGEQALMDCVLLSKCKVLIRTHSNLGSVSSDFNTTMPVITLNQHVGGSFYRGLERNSR